MHQEYDNFRGGWAQIDDDGYEIGFIKDLNAPQHKQKKKKRYGTGGTVGAFIWLVVIGAIIMTLLTQPLLIIIPAAMFFIYKKYIGTPGTMGMIAALIKYVFILYLVYLLGSTLLGAIF